ncbi:MAG: NUDIX hydrolase [Defluviitaleaceae bacterium]|nr:NUDIX hydrolase [Defluviitaleaceae bacterium]
MAYKNGALCLVVRDSKILMVKHRRGTNEYYTLPGGGIEEGETPEQAAIRELREECSVNGRIIKKLCESLYAPDNNATVYIFQVEIEDDEEPVLNLNLSDEEKQVLIEVRWMELREICERDRAFLWAAGLAAVSQFWDELLSWSDDISYPKKRDEYL